MQKKAKKGVVAISGGVDSAVSAFLLNQKGYDLTGIFLRLGAPGSDEAEAVARRICRKLKINFYPVNLSHRFRKEVIDYFTSAYAKGFTPNPCVKCNKFIKFGKLLSLADQVGAEFLATGHYIRKKQTNTGPEESYCLLRAKDKQKDQSYFLYNLTQAQLRRILFPLGDYKKEDVKKIARENNLPVQESESQDICFLQGDHNDFLSQKIKLKPGKIVLISQNNQDQSSERRKKTIGEHQGLPLYTLGQRRGVEIGGSGPYYVVGMDYGQNILYVSSDRDDPLLYLDNFLVKNINWIEPSLPTNKTKCSVVIRYRHQGADCLVELVDKDLLAVKLKTPERAITPGQSAVFYNKEKLLGGGEISANKLK